MAQRLNKKLVVGLTVAGMVVIAGAGALLVYSLPGRDPGPVAEQAATFVTKAGQINENIKAKNQQLAGASAEAAEGLRKDIVELQTQLAESYETAGKYYAKAYNRAMTAGDAVKANDYMVQAGEMALTAGDQRTAMECWKRVLLNNPRHEMAQQKIVQLMFDQAELYGQDWWTQVRKEGERLCEITDSSNLVGLHALGRALVEPGNASDEDLKKGEELLRKAFQRDEGNPKYALSLAMFILRNHERGLAEARRKGTDVAAVEAKGDQVIAEALGVYDTLLKALEKNPPKDASVMATAWRQIGQMHMVVRDAKNAEIRKKQDRLTPAEVEALRVVAKKHAAESLKCMETALKSSPQDSETLALMGAYWLQSTAADPAEREAETAANQEKAKACFEKAIAAAPESFEAYVQLEDFYLRQAESAAARQDKSAMVENFAKADRVLQERVKRGTPRAGINLWRNKAMMSLVRWQLFQLNTLQIERLQQFAGGAAPADVKPLLERLRQIRQDFVAESPAGEKDPRAMFMRARLEMLDNKRYEAIKTFRELQELLDPGEMWARTKLYLAELCMQVEQPGNAIEALQAVVKVYPTLDSALGLLAKALVSVPGREAEAETMAKQALAINPQNSDAMLTLAAVYEKQKNWQALESIQKVLGKDQKTAGNKLLDANLLLARANDPDHPETELVTTAQGLLRGVLKEDPSNLQALRMMASTLTSDASAREELVGLIAKATADIDAKIKAASAASQPAENTIKQLKATKNGIEYLSIVTNPNTSEKERLERTEAIIRTNTDPFGVALGLYQLYIAVPGRQAEAIKYLKDAVAAKPDDAGAAEMLFRVAVSSFKDEKGNESVKPDWKLAEDMAKRLTDLGVDRSGGHYYRGQLLFARQDLKDNFIQAEKEFREGIKVFPLHSNGHAWLGRTLMVLNRWDEAQQELQEAFNQNPRNGLAARLLAEVCSSRGDEEGKVRYLQVCRELRLNDPWTLQQLQILEDQRDPAKGIARREALRKKDPKNYENLIQLANLYERSGKPEQEEQVLDEAVNLQPRNLDFVQKYATFLRDLNPPKAQKAEAAIRKSVESFKPEEKTERATAQLILAAHMETLANKKVPDAPTADAIDAAYKAAEATSDSPRILLDMASRYRRTNEPAKMEEYLRKAVANAERDRDSDMERQARELLLQALLRGKDFTRSAEILKEIETYRAKFKTPLGLLALSEYETMLGRETKAIQHVSEYITQTTGPQKAVGYYRRGSMNYRRGDWDLAIKDFREAKALTADGFDYDHRILLARSLQMTGQTDQAVTELKSILQENRRAMRAAEELYRIYMASEKYDDAEAFIMPAHEQEPKSPMWIGLLTEVAAARKDYNLAIQRAAMTVTNSNYAPRKLDNLLSIYLQFKRYDDMVEYVNTKVPEAQRNHFAVQARMAVLNEVRGDKAKASQLFAQAVQGGREEVLTLDAIVLDLPKCIGADQALAFMTREAASHPDDNMYQYLLAKLYWRQAKELDNKAQDASLSVTEVATTKEAENKEIDAFLKIVEPLVGKLAQADAKQLNLRVAALQALAEVQYDLRRQYEPARKVYEELLQVAPKDAPVRPVAMNNLGYLLTENLHDPASGVRYAEQANELIPGQTNVMDSLGWALILNGQYDRGIALVRGAITSASAIEIAQMAAIHYHAAYGLVKRAEQSRQRGASTDADEDLNEAKLDCRRAYDLLKGARLDGDGVLAKVVELGAQIGLTLDAKQPAASQPKS
jgi:tetratricopeptide (TPR) repeat protein